MIWRKYLFLEDSVILRECDLSHTRGSGPGGQKRNKTSSAVRLVHRPSGISIRAEESRSQKTNLKYALHRLKNVIAFQMRHDPPEPIQLAQLRGNNPAHIAQLLDHLHHHNYAISDAAESIHATTGALSAFICSNELLLIEVNRQRALLQLKPLRTTR